MFFSWLYCYILSHISVVFLSSFLCFHITLSKNNIQPKYSQVTPCCWRDRLASSQWSQSLQTPCYVQRSLFNIRCHYGTMPKNKLIWHFHRERARTQNRCEGHCLISETSLWRTVPPLCSALWVAGCELQLPACLRFICAIEIRCFV